jgi:hypothetical protein
MQYLILSLFRDYQCAQCGECCHGWNIEVQPWELKEIVLNVKKIPKEQRPDYGFNVCRDEEKKITNVYFRMTENHCGFLQKDNKCFLHCQFGLDIKPGICKSYPLYAIRTPKITYVTITFSCMAACRLLLAQEIPTIVSISGQYFGKVVSLKTDVSEQKWVKISPTQTIAWDTYYSFQQYIFACKKQEIVPLLHSFWYHITHFPHEHLTFPQLQEMASLPCTTPSNPLLHLKWICRVWEAIVQYEVEPAVFVAISFLLCRLQMDATKIEESVAVRYEKYLRSSGLWKDHNIVWILNNYFRSRLFVHEIYFTRSVCEFISLMSLLVGFIAFLGLASAGTSPISSENILEAVFVVEKYLSHSDVLDYIQLDDINPRIAISPL